MNRPRHLILAGSIFLGLTCTAHAQLRSMRLLTPNTGWVLSGDRLLRTSSAGFEWTDITPPASPARVLYGAFFLDPSSGWVLRSGSDAAAPELARTSDAGFYGSIPGIRPPIMLAAPIVGMAATTDGKGYWLVGADGGIYAFGDAGFYGSIPGIQPPIMLNAPITGMARTTGGKGYWLVGADGGIFAFGDAPFFGSFVGKSASPVVGIVYDNAGGYMVVTSNDSTYSAN